MHMHYITFRCHVHSPLWFRPVDFSLEDYRRPKLIE